MNRSELSRKLKQNAQDYNKKMSEIDNKSRARERNKLNELINKSTEIDIKTPKTEQKQTIPEEKTEQQKELYKLFSQWDNYKKAFPNNKYIWKNNFPEWFIEAMEVIESDNKV